MSWINHIPAEYREGSKNAAEAIATLDYSLLAAHVNLDGDALGSLIGCGCILKALGKHFCIYSSTGIPKYLSILDLPGPVYTDLAMLPFEPQSAIYLDCSEASRLGSQLEHRVHDWPSVNVDHHLAEQGLGSIYNFIDHHAAATAQLVAYIAFNLQMHLKGMLAMGIATGLMTDTGGFCHGNTTADVFSLCALLARSGCPINDLREQLQNSWSIDRLRLWGTLYLRVKLYDNKQIAICPVTLDDMREYHCRSEDLEGLVEIFRKIHGVKVAAILREEAPKAWKFSLRSYGDIDVCAMASILDGGGHKNAAGGMIHLPGDEAEKLLLNVIENNLVDKIL